MFAKFFTVLVLCGLVQINSSAPADIIASYGPQIQNLQIRIGSIIRASGQEIGITRGQINRNVALAERTVSTRVGQVSDLIQQAKSEAASEECVKQAGADLANLDLKQLNGCRVSEELDLLGLRLADLGKLKNTLGNLASACQSATSSDESLTNCLDDGLEVAKNEADQSQLEISQTCVGAVETSAVCTEKVSSRLNLALNNIASELKTCVLDN